jgi:hypothetical protein
LGGEPVVVIPAGEEVGNQEEDPVKILAFVEGRPRKQRVWDEAPPSPPRQTERLVSRKHLLLPSPPPHLQIHKKLRSSLGSLDSLLLISTNPSRVLSLMLLLLLLLLLFFFFLKDLRVCSRPLIEWQLPSIDHFG